MAPDNTLEIQYLLAQHLANPDAVSPLETALECAEKLDQGHPERLPLITYTALLLGHAKADKKQYPDAYQYLDKALKAAQKNFEKTKKELDFSIDKIAFRHIVVQMHCNNIDVSVDSAGPESGKAALVRDYNESIRNGNDYYNSGDYENALVQYKAAFTALENPNFPDGIIPPKNKHLLQSHILVLGTKNDDDAFKAGLATAYGTYAVKDDDPAIVKGLSSLQKIYEKIEKLRKK